MGILDKKWRHPEAPTKQDELWNLMLKLWKDFDDRPKEWKEWEAQENLVGLMEGFRDNLPEFLRIPSNKDLRAMNMEQLTDFLAGLVCGVRLGNAIANERSKVGQA